SGVDADATLRAVADALTRGESRILLRAERRAHDRRTGVHADPGYVEKLADALVGTACEVTLFRSRPGGAINGMDPRLETQLTAAGVALRVSYEPFLGVAQGLLHEDAFDVAIQNGIDALERRWVQEIWLSTEAVHEAGGDASVEL